jgi:hypothetical protein
MVELILKRDAPIIGTREEQSYCIEQRDMVFRLNAVNVIVNQCNEMGLGTAAAWTAVRLFDTFHTKKIKNPTWIVHWPIVSSVCVDIAGKVVARDGSPCCYKHLACMHDVLVQQRGVADVVRFDDFVNHFEKMQVMLLNLLDFEVRVPTPNEYLTKTTHWFDDDDATLGLGRRAPRPEEEIKTARMTMFICMSLLYTPLSMYFRTADIVGFASYVASYEYRPAAGPQCGVSSTIATPALKGIWSSIPWTTGRELSKIMSVVVKYLENSAISELYREEYSWWVNSSSSTR